MRLLPEVIQLQLPLLVPQQRTGTLLRKPLKTAAYYAVRCPTNSFLSGYMLALPLCCSPLDLEFDKTCVYEPGIAITSSCSSLQASCAAILGKCALFLLACLE